VSTAGGDEPMKNLIVDLLTDTAIVVARVAFPAEKKVGLIRYKIPETLFRRATWSTDEDPPPCTWVPERALVGDFSIRAE